MVVPTRLPLVADGEHKRQERFGTLWPILTSVEGDNSFEYAVRYSQHSGRDCDYASHVLDDIDADARTPSHHQLGRPLGHICETSL